jgi:hypothetical protein
MTYPRQRQDTVVKKRPKQVSPWRSDEKRVRDFSPGQRNPGMSLIKSHIKKLTKALYQKSAGTENTQIQELGQYDPVGNKHLRPLSLLAR